MSKRFDVSTLPKITQIQQGRGSNRAYLVEGRSKTYPSVTTTTGIINKPALVGWAKKVTRVAIQDKLQSILEKDPSVLNKDNIRDYIELALGSNAYSVAADIGNEVHNGIECIIQGLPYEPPELVEHMINQFKAWYNTTDIEILHTEIRLFSDKFEFGGTADAIGYYKGTNTPIIIDWKTSAGIYPEYWLQVAAYSAAWCEMTGEVPKDAYILRFPKQRGQAMEIKRLPATAHQMSMAWKTFLAAHRLKQGLSKGDMWCE